MLDLLYWVAAVIALAGVIFPPRNRVTWPLLSSFAFYQVAVWQGWGYDPTLWATVDCAVLIGIAILLFNEWRKDRDWLPSRGVLIVLALFVPIIIAYALRHNGYEHAAHIVSMSAAIAQLLVVPPYPALLARWKANFRNRREWTDLDLRVAA